MPNFTTFILKVASRCNLDCSYCYMYKLADQSWVDQPNVMTSEIWQVSANKIASYAKKHQLSSVGIILHGGEPLLLGKQRTESILTDFHSALAKNGIKGSYGLQTNGTLLDENWIDLFHKFDVHIGISIDGDKDNHDKNRTYHSGQGSYSAVRKAIDLARSSPKGKDIFSGVLSVINIESDPIMTLHSFLDMGVKSIDFLFPDLNYESIPPGKEDFNNTPFGDWLISIFDEYLKLNDPDISIRMFEVLMSLCLGYQQDIDMFGCTPIKILVIETNGDLNALDCLKASVQTYLGANILNDDLECSTINHSELIKIQAGGYQSLCSKCQECDNVSVCGGGYLPHRYSNLQQFDNPSIYCADIYKLIEHIKAKLSAMKQ